jgi:hypothetical protein
MKQFLVTLPRNLIGCFTGWRLVWHLIAIVLTFILVMSGFDWRYFLAARNPALRAWMWPAVVAGMFLPIYLPLILFAVGIIARSAKIILTGWAVAQAELLGALIGRLQGVYGPRPSGTQCRPRHQPCLPFRLSARGSFLGLAIVAYHHCLCHGRDGVHALAETTMAGGCGAPLRFLYWHWCLYDHPLVLGFCGRSHHRLGHRNRCWEEFWGNIQRSTFNVQCPRGHREDASFGRSELSVKC